MPRDVFAAHAAHLIRTRGFRSRQHARGTDHPATADLALEALTRDAAAPGRRDHALADAALRWGRVLARLKTSLTSFEGEASRAAHRPRLDRRERGLVTALIATYRQRRARSRHLAAPGDPLQLTVLVEAVTECPSARYPGLRRCDLLDGHGNRLAWWQTSGTPLRIGQVLVLHGRVSRHTHFGTDAVTVLRRCQRQPAANGAEETSGAMEVCTTQPLT